MIMSMSSSKFFINCSDSTRCSVDLNVVNLDTAFLYMSNTREQYQLTANQALEEYNSYLTNVDFKQNTVELGGQLITIMDGNLAV